MEPHSGRRRRRVRVRTFFQLSAMSACSLGASHAYVAPALRLDRLHRANADLSPTGPGLARRYLASAVAMASVLSSTRKVSAVPKSISQEDKALVQAERTVKQGRKLEEEGLLLEAEESSVLGEKDVSKEEQLERKEERLTLKIKDTERKLLKERADIERGLNDLRTEEELIKKKVEEAEQEQKTLAEEYTRLQLEEEQLLASEDRLNQDIFRQRRDRAPRVFNIIPAMQELFKVDKV